MMKEEFEKIAGRSVTSEQYSHIEQLYLESNLNKYDFVKSIKGLLKSIPEQHNYPVLVMGYHNQYGDMLTPNHAYYMSVRVQLINVDIRNGKRTVKVVPDSMDFVSRVDMTDWDRNLEIIW